ncbi:hypothetical protein MSG28_001806 [Choristoneura fumiferana]|uniref:Uncharacterized protein n=1 Tax=Choristoneura fumiferana TaxID=7141 RepID=A0ACC0KWB9_CHOFU|nr:hypothetical protein MSG28_001806 [Choristoneura fumiferana]
MRVPEVIQFGTKDSVILDCDFTTDNLDLTFKVSNNVYTQHRALRILNPSTDLTGNYTCVVSTYLAEDKGTKPMTIFVPETRFDMIQDRLEDGYLNIICAVEGVFPKPELIILAGNRSSKVIQFGTKDSVILDCDFTTENVTGLVVKWFFMDRAQSLDLTFKVSNNVYTQHRALRILNPSTDLTGNYTCVVSTYLAEDKGTKPMTIFVPETRFDMIQDRLEDGYLNIICAVEGVFPKPELIILAGNSALVRVEALPPTVEILCDMQVPLANYFSRKRDIFYRDPPPKKNIFKDNEKREEWVYFPNVDIFYYFIITDFPKKDNELYNTIIINSFYISALGPGLSHRHRLAWLQRRRGPGLWVQCDSCDTWRHLPHVVDAHQLPPKWYCSMNPEKSMANCSVPEAPLRVTDEEDLIHSEYSAGSLTHYNVVFFDAADVTRAWISPENLKPFTSNKKKSHTINDKKYKKRLEKAMQLAEKAEKLPVLDRLAEFSFISTYKGAIVSPRKVTKRELEKFQNQLKRKFNVDFPIEVSSESDGEIQIIRENNKRKNVILIGTPKIKKTNPVLIGNDDEDNTVFNNGDGDSGQFDNNKKSKESKLNIETNVATPMRKEATKSAHYNKKPRNIINDIVKEISKNSDSEIKETENTVGGPSTVNSNETFEQCTNEVSPNKSKHPNPDSMAIEILRKLTFLKTKQTR